MGTHATADRRWTQEDLADLPVEDHFRLRGLEVTRLDTFVDAAFAFAFTLLVISFDAIPSDYTEMVAAAKRIPGFAASFAVLMLFWRQHRTWSRQFGLENSQTILLSQVLIFVMLIYVYPLRMVFEGLFAQISGGFFSPSYRIETYDELRMMFVFYSVGFLAMSLVVSALYRVAVRNADALALNPVELRKTRVSVHVWAIAAGFALLSILLAAALPDGWVSTAGYIYFPGLAAMRIPAWLDRRA